MTAPSGAADRAHLLRTLDLAERGARTAAPNPVVGAVVVRDGEVLGEGWHERPGGDHAEVAALRAAGDAREATVYVSLEPCCHHGRTPPCTEALIGAGVARVVVAAVDPSARVDGKGIVALRAAGIEVDMADEDVAARARRQNAAFRTLALLGRPHVTYKAAASLDGRTATASGESQWISSPQSRALVHEWRACSAAVAVGIGTALRDDPALTARDLQPPAERQPLRIVFDRQARLPLESQLVSSAHAHPVLVACEADAPGRGLLEEAGVETFTGSASQLLQELGRRRLSSLLVEGGATLAAALLADGLIDRLAVFAAPLVLGEGPGLFAGWAADGLERAPQASAMRAEPVGPDILLTAELREV
jgi:diaminohydroxyphosphoribosylaminopyrimidine deaminase / 5-amino-6-(5-phosphoribosylamino)uracil reductase